MALTSPIAKKMGIRYPIFGLAHNVDVMVALGKAGGYPVFGAARSMPDEITEVARVMKEELGDLPFGIDLMLPTTVGDDTDRDGTKLNLPEEHQQFIRDLTKKYNVPKATKPTFFSSQIRSQQLFEEQLAATLESDAHSFASAVGMPAEMISQAKDYGKITFSLVGAPRHAEKAKAAGVDVIVAQGYDAGGHTGPIGTFSLVPQVVDVAGDIPVLAAGGVGHGRHIAASFGLGAQGVWLGTAWLASKEHALCDALLNKLLKANSLDTTISLSHSGKSCRLIKSAWSEEWDQPDAPKPLKMPYQQVLTADIIAGIDEHEIEPLIYEATGQSIAWFNELMTVEEIVQRLVSESNAALSSMSDLLAS
ncbi:nitronate monooxygenase family protein [Sneathiella sp.]|uniref:NAD(P)H-dependent flavin oxidoreductase n=1 Tax=Sneathiella sp. TaxID=1964365 RepID=UPI002605D060|nr:nitronate monooxygenase [Sneathiella sp.]MDF2366705.1 nitronate monooxygenase [Sneathiella sp.]